MLRFPSVLIFVVALTLASGAAAQTTRPATTRLAASRPKPVDPFAEGSQIEAKWGNVWYSATIVTRTPEGAAVKFSDGRRETKTKMELRARGVTTDEVKPDFVVRYFGRDARVEYAQGPWWYDGVIIKRDGPRALVRDAHGFTNWKELTELRSREITPGGVGTIPPAAPAAGVAERAPAAPGAPAAKGEPGAADEGMPADPAGPPGKLASVELNGAKTLSLDSYQGAWSAHPDPATPPAQAAAAKSTPIALPPLLGKSKNFWERFVGDEVRLYVSPGATSGVVVQQATPHQGGTLSRAERVDFATGSVSPAVELPRGTEVTAASPDGKRALIQWRGKFNELGSVVRIVSLEGRTATTVADFRPFLVKAEHEEAVHGAAFLDADHVLLAAGVNAVELVDVSKPAVVWAGHPGTIDAFAISPGGHQLALPTDAGVFLVEPMTGNPIGRFEGEGRRWAWMRFSDDGSRLAAYDAGAVCVWDVHDGRVVTTAEVGWRGDMVGGRIDWLSNDYLLLDGDRLLDLSKSTVVWTYDYGEGERAASGKVNPAKVVRRSTPGGASVGGRLWFAAASARETPQNRAAGAVSRSDDALIPVTLPEPAVTQQLAAMKPEELYAIWPGAKVNLSVNVQTPDAQKLNAGITDALKKAGLVVVAPDHAAEATIRLEASTSAGESKTVQYQRSDAFGRPTGQESATFTSTKLRVALIRAADGKVLWERTTTSGGGGGAAPVLLVKGGESAQEAANRQQANGFDWFFTTARYPAYLSKGGEGKGFGSSVLTDKGPQPEPPAKP